LHGHEIRIRELTLVYHMQVEIGGRLGQPAPELTTIFAVKAGRVRASTFTGNSGQGTAVADWIAFRI